MLQPCPVHVEVADQVTLGHREAGLGLILHGHGGRHRQGGRQTVRQQGRGRKWQAGSSRAGCGWTGGRGRMGKEWMGTGQGAGSRGRGQGAGERGQTGVGVFSIDYLQ